MKKLNLKVIKTPLFIIFTSFAIVGVMILIILGIFYIKDSKNSYKSILLNFKPTTFKIKINQPIFFSLGNKLFYSSGNKLFYSETGLFELKQKPIYVSEYSISQYEYLTHCNNFLVSPNLRMIVITDDKSVLRIIDNKGKILITIPNVIKCDNHEEIKSGNFSAEYIQWSANSKNIYFYKYKKFVDDFDESNKLELWKISIKNKKLLKVFQVDEKFPQNFYLSPDEKFIYDEMYNSLIDEFFIAKIDQNSGKILDSIYRQVDHKLDISSDKLFLCVSNYNFPFSAYTKDKIVVSFEDSTKHCLYLIENNKDTKLLEGTLGYESFKGYRHGFDASSSQGGFFLPGDRFYIYDVDSETFTGRIVFDTETGRYMKVEPGIQFHFNVIWNGEIEFWDKLGPGNKYFRDEIRKLRSRLSLQN